MSAGLPQAVLFDLDGTLAHTMPYHLQAWQECLHTHYGAALEPGDQRTHAGTTQSILESILRRPVPPAESAEIHGWKEQRFRDLAAAHLRPLPGLRAYLDRLAALRVPAALVTGADRRNTAFMLTALHLTGTFGVQVTVEDVTRPKPHPEPYLLAARQLGVDPRACLVHEDTPAGIRSALDAGMTVAALTTSCSAGDLLRAGARWAAPDHRTWPTTFTMTAQDR